MKLLHALPVATLFALAHCGSAPPALQSAQPATLASAPPPALTYAIHMYRATSVGDRTHAVIDKDKHEHILVREAGKAADKTEKRTHVHLDGVVVVQEVDDRAETRRYELIVNDLWRTVGDGAHEVLAPAHTHVTIARAARKEDALVTVGGQPASNELREAIDALFTLSVGGPNDDEIFGTTEPQAIGAEWSMNDALAEKDLNEKGMNATPGSLTGKTRLAGVTRVDGVECLDLASDLAVSSIASMDGLPEGSVVESGRVSAHMQALFPLDVKLGRRGEDVEISVQMKVRVPSPQGNVVVDARTVSHRRASYSPP